MKLSVADLDDACRISFEAFAEKAFGVAEQGVDFEYNWHIGCIADHLEAVFRGEIKRLIINIPPRTLKSYLVARAFPAWVMGKVPHSKFISTSYGEPVAEQNSLACKKILKSEWYQRLFKTRMGDLDRNTHWTTDGGGQYYAASALSPITGIGADYVIIDDPLKPMEAYSDPIRKSTNENIRATLLNRLNDKRTGRVIMIMQRLHEDDPTGNLLKDGTWTHLKLPSEAHKPISIHLGKNEWKMAEGELLFPSRLSRDILDQTRMDMTEYHYAGQYLQEPVPVGGGEFKEEWINYYKLGSIKPSEMNIFILVDPAGGEELQRKKHKLSDRTAMMVVGLGADNNFYLLDAICDRLNPTERIDALFDLHRKWNALTKRPPKVGYEKYALMTDTHYIKLKQNSENYRFPMVELGGVMAKNERIRRMIPDMQKQRWYFPENIIRVDYAKRTINIVDEIVHSEMGSFPKARYDDCIDALSRIYDDELMAVFPTLQPTMKDRMIWQSASQSQDSWMDF